MEQVEDNSIADRLLVAVGTIDRPGTFCCTGNAPPILCGLEVAEMGTIGTPLLAAQAEELKRHCQRASFGKGMMTLTDTNVRRVWKLSPEKFSLSNPAWEGALKEIVTGVQRELGLEKQTLEAHLYELLLYEKGGFFLPHRDGEKLDRMVATLVVVLPSSHSGGELVVSHEEEEQAVDFAGAKGARYQTQYAAFYADCEHEVKPLKSGFRICLVYNLVLTKSKKKRIGAPRTREQVERIAEVLRDWPADVSAPDKLAITLSHEYTEKGLAWDALKGIDRTRADVLAAAAREAGCQAHLALLTYHQMGHAEGGDAWYGRGRSYRDYDEDDEDNGGSHEMGEIYESSLTAEHWQTADGEKPAFGSLPVEKNEVVPEDSLTDTEPEEDFEGYTGNAGMTLDRWYRHGVIVLWPESRELDVLCAGGARGAIPALKRMIAAWGKARKADAGAMKERCRVMAGKIIERWPTNTYGGRHTIVSAERTADPHDITRYLLQLEDTNLIAAYLRQMLVKDASLEPGRFAIEMITRHGLATFRSELVDLFKACNAETIERNSRFLSDLCSNGSWQQSDGALAACRASAEAVIGSLVSIDAPKERHYRSSSLGREQVLAELGVALLSAGFDDLMSRLIAHLAAFPQQYPLRTVRLPAALSIAKRLKSGKMQRPSRLLLEWLRSLRAEFESLTAVPPAAPADMRREAAVKCKCKDCAELNRFLANPLEQQYQFQRRQELRTHLEQNIRTHQCDVSCATLRGRTPQILVCTKTTASHERRVKEYNEDLKRLDAVRAVLSRIETNSDEQPARNKWKLGRRPKSG